MRNQQQLRLPTQAPQCPGHVGCWLRSPADVGWNPGHVTYLLWSPPNCFTSQSLNLLTHKMGLVIGPTQGPREV